MTERLEPGLHEDAAPFRMVAPSGVSVPEAVAPGLAKPPAEMGLRIQSATQHSRRSSRVVIPPFCDATLYAERTGFRDDFLGDGARLRVPLPAIAEADQILRYANFSIVFCRQRKLARLSAINIDGGRWQRIERRQPDTWSYDPRLAGDRQVGRNLYDGVRYDHAQLVRRQDACSGRDAELAEQDTFHLTNAMPHDLALGSGPWNALEYHVLDTIRLCRSRLTVLAGPIFDDADPADCGIRIPQNYFKIAAYVDDNGHLSAAAWMQRLPWPQEARTERSATAPESLMIWQIPISLIAESTALDLAPLFAADTLGRHRSGQAAAAWQPIPITEADDLLL